MTFTLPLSTAIEYIDPTAEHGYRDHAHQAGIPVGTWKHWRAKNAVSIDGADRISQHLQVHPLEIWGDSYNEWVPDEDEIERAEKRRAKRVWHNPPI